VPEGRVQGGRGVGLRVEKASSKEDWQVTKRIAGGLGVRLQVGDGSKWQ
jgi:hypothetical protein